MGVLNTKILITLLTNAIFQPYLGNFQFQPVFKIILKQMGFFPNQILQG
jgi:hypothetical protein